jgi:HlyD family secretion protein
MAKRKRLGTQIIGWLVAAAVLATPFVWLGVREEPVAVNTGTAGRGHVEQTITAIAAGTVVAEYEAMVAADLMGTVASVSAEEGDAVRQGDVLLQLRHDDLDAQVELARANLAVGESRLEQARIAAEIAQEVTSTQVRQTRAQLDQARNDFQRLEALREKRAISDADFEQARLALRVAEEAFAAARANQGEVRVRQEDVRSAERTLEQLRAAVRVAEATRDKAVVRAPFDGTLTKLLVDPGEAVAVGMPVAHMVNNTGFYVEAPFDEANYAELAPDMPARINIDAYRGVDFAGHIEYIAPAVSMNPDLSRTVLVRIRVDEDADKFLAGMSADVIVLSDQKDDVVYVPTSSIIRNEFVYRIADGRAWEQPVEVGIGNWERTEILSGLEPGQAIVSSVGIRGLEDGVKVRVVDETELAL